MMRRKKDTPKVVVDGSEEEDPSEAIEKALSRLDSSIERHSMCADELTSEVKRRVSAYVREEED